MRNVLRFQFVRYVLVGGINTAFSYAVYAALLYIGLHYVAANLGALLLGILFSFRTQGHLVFRNRNNRLLLRFSGFWLLIYLLNILLIAVLMRTGLNAYLSGALAIVPVTIVSYLVQKYLVFGSAKPAVGAKPSE